MTAPRSPRTPARPRPTNSTASRLFQPSVTGWYAEWKARQTAAAAPPAPAANAEAAPSDDAAEALARWLTGGDAK